MHTDGRTCTSNTAEDNDQESCAAETLTCCSTSKINLPNTVCHSEAEDSDGVGLRQPDSEPTAVMLSIAARDQHLPYKDIELILRHE